MTGEEFSNRVGPLSKKDNTEGKSEYVLENQSEFDKISQNLRVLCRATS
jgi:hypothetical protein